MPPLSIINSTNNEIIAVISKTQSHYVSIKKETFQVSTLSNYRRVYRRHVILIQLN